MLDISANDKSLVLSQENLSQQNPVVRQWSGNVVEISIRDLSLSRDILGS